MGDDTGDLVSLPPGDREALLDLGGERETLLFEVEAAPLSRFEADGSESLQSRRKSRSPSLTALSEDWDRILCFLDLDLGFLCLRLDISAKICQKIKFLLPLYSNTF